MFISFKTISPNLNTVLGKIPNSEEGESHKEAKRASEVGDEGDEGVGEELPGQKGDEGYGENEGDEGVGEKLPADGGRYRTEDEVEPVVAERLGLGGTNLVERSGDSGWILTPAVGFRSPTNV